MILTTQFTLLALYVQAGADVRLADDSGDTALHHACRGSHIDAARALVRYGADMRCRNADNQAPFDLASPEVSYVHLLRPPTGCQYSA